MHERRPAVLVRVRVVHVGAVDRHARLEQQAHRVLVALAGREEQRAEAVLVDRVHVDAVALLRHALGLAGGTPRA